MPSGSGRAFTLAFSSSSFADCSASSAFILRNDVDSWTPFLPPPDRWNGFGTVMRGRCGGAERGRARRAAAAPGPLLFARATADAAHCAVGTFGLKVLSSRRSRADSPDARVACAVADATSRAAAAAAVALAPEAAAAAPSGREKSGRPGAALLVTTGAAGAPPVHAARGAGGACSMARAYACSTARTFAAWSSFCAASALSTCVGSGAAPAPAAPRSSNALSAGADDEAPRDCSDSHSVRSRASSASRVVRSIGWVVRVVLCTRARPRTL